MNCLSLATHPEYGKVIAVGTNYGIRVLDLSGDFLPGWPVIFDYYDDGVVIQGPRLGDFTGDGIPELVIRTHLHKIYTYTMTGERLEHLSFQAPFVPGMEMRSSGAPVVVDVDGDGLSELYFVADTTVFGYNHAGDPLEGFPRSTGEFEGVYDSAPCIGYGEGWSGEPAIFWMTRYHIHGQTLTSGEYLPGFPIELNPEEYCSPLTLIPLADDEWLISLIDKNWIYAFGTDGEYLPGFPKANPFIDNESEASYDIVASDLDGEGVPELLFHRFDGLIFALTLDGEYYPGFPVEVSTLGSAEPVISLRAAGSDSAYIFGVSNTIDPVNSIFGLKRDIALEGFPLQDSLSPRPRVYGQTAVFPPENGNMVLVSHNNRGLVVVYDVPMPGEAFQMDWPMPGCTPGGNRFYRPETILDVREDRGELLLPSDLESRIYPNPSNGGFRFELAPDGTGRAMVTVYDLLGRLIHHQELRGSPHERLHHHWKAWSDGRPLAAGVYFVRLKGATTTIKKAVLLP